MHLHLANKSEKFLLQELLQTYLKEYSQFEEIKQDSNGNFAYKYFDSYWQEKDRLPLLIKDREKVIGFIFVRLNIVGIYNSIAEFFIKQEYRKLGFGTNALKLVFEQYPGEWRLEYAKKNLVAKNFWLKTISNLTGNTYQIKSQTNEKEEISFRI